MLDVVGLVWPVFRGYLLMDACHVGRGMSQDAYYVIWWVKYE
jgi:hypothetical protein